MEHREASYPENHCPSQRLLWNWASVAKQACTSPAGSILQAMPTRPCRASRSPEAKVYSALSLTATRREAVSWGLCGPPSSAEAAKEGVYIHSPRRRRCRHKRQRRSTDSRRIESWNMNVGQRQSRSRECIRRCYWHTGTWRTILTGRMHKINVTWLNARRLSDAHAQSKAASKSSQNRRAASRAIGADNAQLFAAS